MWAMNDSIKSWYWMGGLLGCFGETAQVLAPLLLKVHAYIRGHGWQCMLTNRFSRDGLPSPTSLTLRTTPANPPSRLAKV